MDERRSRPRPGTSPARVRAVEAARAAVAESEERLRDLESQLAEHEREVQRADEQRRALPIIVDLVVFPSVALARERGMTGARLRSGLAIERERIEQRRTHLRDAEAMAIPMSEGAQARLEQIVATTRHDDELARLGIVVGVLARTPEGRAHLRALAAEYGIDAGD